MHYKAACEVARHKTDWKLWVILGMKIYCKARQFDYVFDLKKEAIAAWVEITLDVIQKLIVSMPRKGLSCICL